MDPRFSTSALVGDEWSASHPGRFAPCIYCIGGWLRLRAGLGAVEKREISFPCRETNLGRPARRHT
jgi:hypothetical protein